MYDMFVTVMGKKSDNTFGYRLAILRKNQGLTQAQLGEKVGVSLRVISYYERESEYPPAHLIPELAKALKVSVEELLGIKKIPLNGGKTNRRLFRYLNQIDNLPTHQQRILLKTIDTFLKGAAA